MKTQESESQRSTSTFHVKSHNYEPPQILRLTSLLVHTHLAIKLSVGAIRNSGFTEAFLSCTVFECAQLVQAYQDASGVGAYGVGAIVPTGRASLGARSSAGSTTPGPGSTAGSGWGAAGAQAEEAALGIEEMCAELRRLHARLCAIEAERAQQRVHLLNFSTHIYT